MKYYNLPTSQQIADYHSGQLSIEKNQWIEKLMSNNPFVKSAVEAFPLDQQNEIQSISERISGKINRNHIQSRGFWNRFGSWISLSLLLLLIGVLAVLKMSPDNKYTQEGILLAKDQHKGQISEQSKLEQNTQNAEHLIAQDALENKEHEALMNATTTAAEVLPKTEQEAGEFDTKTADLTTVDSEANTEKQTKLSGKLLKSVRSVILISKDFDVTFKRNLPEFPGGDRALFDYFRTQLKPVELDYSEGVFDAVVTFHLTVDKKGIESTFKIDGALHPIHENQLANCVAKLPRFKPGQSDVTYRLEIAFN